MAFGNPQALGSINKKNDEDLPSLSSLRSAPFLYWFSAGLCLSTLSLFCVLFSNSLSLPLSCGLNSDADWAHKEADQNLGLVEVQ